MLAMDMCSLRELGDTLTYHWRVIVVIVGLVFPTQIVVVFDDEAGILVLSFALLRFLFRISRKVVFGQVVGKSRHA